MSVERRDKLNYYLDIAETVLERGTCLRRNYGSIIVKNDEIIATGYAGAPRGRKNCIDLAYCRREQQQIPRGTRYELCRSVHAEANAIISASRRDMMDATLYLVGFEADGSGYVQNPSSCSICKRLIINSGISTVIIRKTRDDFDVVDVDTEWINYDDTIDGDGSY